MTADLMPDRVENDQAFIEGLRVEVASDKDAAVPSCERCVAPSPHEAYP